MSTTFYPDSITAAPRTTRRAKTVLGRALQVLAICTAIVPFAIAAGPIPGTELKVGGQMIDIGGRSLRLVCAGPTGSSKPVVLFESGAFGFAGDWAFVQKQLTAEGVWSCAYDRAGMGFSDTSDEPRDGVNVAQDLEYLVAAANIPAPFVLVGHSMAGARVHLFANRNPEKVAGLVLVDSTTPDAMADSHVAKSVSNFTHEAHAASLTAQAGILHLLAGTALGDKVGLPPEEDAQKRHQFASATYNRTSYEEVKNWPLAAQQAAETGPLNTDWPVAVISAGILSADEGAQIQALQPPPAMASKHGFISVVDGATHNGLLGKRYSVGIVQGIDFVLGAAVAGPQARAKTVRMGIPFARG